MWKSDNQGVKEESFIHTGRRVRDRQLERRALAARWWLGDWSYICVQINQEEQLGNETDHVTLGSSVGK